MRMVESGGLALLIGNNQADWDSFGNLKIFDLLDQTCTAELLQRGTHEVLARNLHSVYLENSGSVDGDDALVPWEELSDYLKEKNRQQADRIPLMLTAAGYRIAPLQDWDAEDLTFDEKEEVSKMARIEHEHWCQEKKEEGWKYGSEKDSVKKTNPSLLPWDDLAESEHEKNKEFIRSLPNLLARAGIPFRIQDVQPTRRRCATTSGAPIGWMPSLRPLKTTSKP